MDIVHVPHRHKWANDGIARVIRNDLQVGVYINLCAVESNLRGRWAKREIEIEECGLAMPAEDVGGVFAGHADGVGVVSSRD